MISGGHLARENEYAFSLAEVLCTDTSTPRLESLTDTFFEAFRVPESSKSVSVWHLVGNHDVGLGYPTPYSRRARERFMRALDIEPSAVIGTNQAIEFRNHTLFLLDAPGFADEDHIRIKARKILKSHASFESFRHPLVQGSRKLPDDANIWMPQQNGAMEYVQKTTRSELMSIS